MAEVLVKAQDAPVPDSPAKWVRGMVASVKPDGWSWGAREGLPRFILIKAPKWTVEDVQRFLEQEDFDGGRKRVYRIVDEVIQQAIANGGVLEINLRPDRFRRDYVQENQTGGLIG